MNIHPTVKEAAVIFLEAGKQIYLVGGAVRDLLRSGNAKDWDLATDALPEEVIALFGRGKKGARKTALPHRCFVIPTGIKHGTVTLHFRDLKMEVTTFRTESGYSDGRRPDNVEFGVSMAADLSRRDFTMNAAAFRLPGGPLLDPYKGERDIKNRIIRSVGDPRERFSEDGLRPLRAVRFASQLDYTVDDELLAAIPDALPLTARVAAERIRDELDKIIISDKPSKALLLMEQTGLLALLVPELAACRGANQTHHHDVLSGSLLACDFAAREGTRAEVRLAALFHKIGDGGKASAALTRTLLQRLRYSNVMTDKVCRLIEEQSFNYEYQESWSDADVRRFIIRAGQENLNDLHALCRACFYGKTGEEPPRSFLLPLINRIKEILAQNNALSLKDLAISGKDLIDSGIPSGKHMGFVLNGLLGAVLENPALNTREKLLEMAEKINQR